MGWLTKIFKGSSYKGQYHGKHGEDRYWDEHRRSVVIVMQLLYKFLISAYPSYGVCLFFLTEGYDSVNFIGSELVYETDEKFQCICKTIFLCLPFFENLNVG